MIEKIRTAALAAGVNVVDTNSEEKIESQLNRYTRFEDLPIMLVNWNLETSYSFNEHGFLDNPTTPVTVLLLEKSEDKTKEEYEKSTKRMQDMFQVFIQELYSQLIPFQKQGQTPLTSISSTLVHKYGAGKHSGVLGQFSVSDEIITQCT